MKDTLIEHVHNTHSTNGLLSSMLQGESASERKIPPFFALWADFQSAGRGMGSNRWFSEEGKNLLVSFYFEPGIPASRQFLFNQYFSVATCRFMAQRVSDVAIKWPNDIYVGGKKIAGILIEHVIQGDKLKHTIAGIGINLNQDRFPSEIPNPTSLWMETGKHYDVEEFLHQYQQFLRAQYAQLSVLPAAANALREAYLGRLYQRDIPHRYRIQGQETTATILGVDDFGRLQLRDENGTDYSCGTKEVVFL
ncbi:MAG: biotin--[acetyl-CoA-carboxylase] ligase [Bacteroidales bacterium]|nr:biotin--[acetyl-CoA-carboxylase] ligase [Bacteroidales bacterium]